MKKFLAVVPIALVCAQTPAPKPAAPKPAVHRPVAPKVNPADPVVLTVGTEKITKSQFESIISGLPENRQADARGAGKKRFAENISELKVMVQEAKKRKLNQDPQVALQLDNTLANALYQKILSGIKSDDAALHAYYDAHKADFEQVRARHILIRMKGSRVPLKPDQKDLTEEEALAKAKEIREKLVAGEDFAALAKKESDDGGSGSAGGDLSWFGRGRMTPPFEQAAFALQAGQLSEPVKTEFGYHLIRMDQRVAKTFEQAQSEIESKMKNALADEAVKKIRKLTPIVLNEAYFGK